MLSLEPSNPSLGKLQLFANFFVPIGRDYSVASKIGTVIFYSLEQSTTIQLQKHSGFTWTNYKDQITKYFEEPDPFLMNGIGVSSQRYSFLDYNSVCDFLKSNDGQSFYFATEFRRLISSSTGIAFFCNTKLNSNKSPDFLIGIGARSNVPLGGILFDVGWDIKKSDVFWRFRIGENF
jgi:hypothetical protein